ncbi:MAG: TerC family protein [Candidatus Omnitrophica bacterium]|nr:TerC family protein [Candidatus Omnitrophota bacterium]
MTARFELWAIFGIAITAMLFVDLFVVNRKSHAISVKEALKWVAIWVGAALIFCAGIFFLMGKVKALEFLTGYILEESLSVDNLFVFIMIFEYFHVPRTFQPRVLKWGIIGAIVLRALFIVAGVGLFTRFDWITYVFGAFLVFTAVKLVLRKEEKFEPEKNPLLRLFRRFFRVSQEYHEDRFFVLHNGVWAATPLFIALLLIESSDVIFAMDSIPAILAITKDPFIVYTSNIFAILGLRSLFFVISGMMSVFRYLKMGISAILCFVGIKMLISHFMEIDIRVSLAVIFGLLAVSILASVIHKEKGDK